MTGKQDDDIRLLEDLFKDVIAVGQEPYCFRCKKTASELITPAFLHDYYEEGGHSPSEFVRQEDGTYNRQNNRFCCDSCYIAIGQPANPWPGPGWKAP